MKVLVTGASGLVGSQLTKNLSKNFEVLSGYHSQKPLFGKPIQLDLSKLDNISATLQIINPDAIIHLAALTDVDGCESNKELAFQINAKATAELAKYANLQKIFILYVSTDYVFDGKVGLQKESDTPNPLGVYGKSKLEGEKAIMNFASKWCIARTSTPFGVSKLKKTFPLWVYENLKQNNKVNAAFDQFTSPTYVPNLCEMLEEILTKQLQGIIHTAGASAISRYDFAKLIAENFDYDSNFLKKISMEDLNWVAPRPKNSSLDVTKAKNLLENKPQLIQESLQHFTDQINDNKL